MSRPADRAALDTANIVDPPARSLVEDGEAMVCRDGGVASQRAGRVFR